MTRLSTSWISVLAMLGYRSPTRGKIRSAGHHRKLAAEHLESRTLLAVTGVFERSSEGIVVSAAESYADAAGHWGDTPAYFPMDVNGYDDAFDQETITTPYIAHSSTTAMAIAHGEFAFSHTDTNAQCLTPIGETTVIPMANVDGMSELTVTIDKDSYEGYWAAATSTYSAISDCVYYFSDFSQPANPAFTGVLSIAGWGGAYVENGHFYVLDRSVISEIWINDALWARISATAVSQSSTDSWSLTGFIPGIGSIDETISGLNQTYYIVQQPIGGNSKFEFISYTTGNFRADADFEAPLPPSHALSAGTLNTLGAAWGYITGTGADLQDGDFNADGNVDAADYNIWAANRGTTFGASLAKGDADRNGIVDQNDYAIWAANANAILVTTNLDVVNPNDGVTSLREAIALAGDANHAGVDTIAFDASLLGSTISLSPSQSWVTVTNPVNILGPGAGQLTLNANGKGIFFAIQGGSASPIASRISHVKLTGATGTNGSAIVMNSWATGIHDLTLDNSQIVGNKYGIRWSGSYGHASVDDCDISLNSVAGIARPTGSVGGAILTLSDSTVATNGGAGIDLSGVMAEIVRTQIVGNDTTAAANTYAVRIANGATLALIDSTVAENIGAGILVSSGSASANIRNSTISSNGGVGLSVSNGSATLTNATVTQNRVSTGGVTAGLYANSGGTITLYNTIVAENFSGQVGSQVSADLGRNTSGTPGSFSIGTSAYNLVGEVGNSGITSSGNNIIIGAGVSAGLSELGYYGGPTKTHLLLSGCQATDAGFNDYADEYAFDQRGEGHDRIFDFDGDSNVIVDIGAIEMAFGDFAHI